MAYGEDRAVGFVVIHRRIQSSPEWVSLRGEQRSVVLTLLLLANWKPGVFWHGTHKIEVGRGELAHSLATIADHAAVSLSVCRRTVDLLIARGFLSTTGVHKDTGVRVLRIVNYGKYQAVNDESGTATDAPAAPVPTQATHGPRTGVTPIEPSKPDQPVFSSFPPGEQRKRKRRAEDKAPTNPRFHALKLALVAAFEAKRGKYTWHSRDAKGLERLLTKGDDAEILRRWGLAIVSDFYRCTYIFDLDDKWGRFDGPKPLVREAPLRAVPKPALPDVVTQGDRDAQADRDRWLKRLNPRDKDSYWFDLERTVAEHHGDPGGSKKAVAELEARYRALALGEAATA